MHGRNRWAHPAAGAYVHILIGWDMLRRGGTARFGGSAVDALAIALAMAVTAGLLSKRRVVQYAKQVKFFP